MTKNNKEDIKEFEEIIKDVKGKRCKSAPKEKPMLEWTAGELNAYIIKETAGMSVVNKFKFAKQLDQKIKKLKAEKKKN